MRFERFDLRAGDWAREVERLPSGLVCQTPEWLAFLEQSQHGEAVAALLLDGDRKVGVFAGMIVRRMGLRILGSPFPGWTTPYMGIDLVPGVARRDALAALIDFAWNELGCVHLEMMDRHLALEDVPDVRFQHRMFNTFEVDLGASDEELLKSYGANCRAHVKKAARHGITVEEATAHDDTFIDEYYAQLTEIFARQNLVPTYPRSRVEALIANVPPDRLMLIRARTREGIPAATGIFHAVDKERAYGWGLASLREHGALHPTELLMFHAMNRWRARGLRIMDLGGSGEYKKKYHPRPVSVPWIRISRYPFIPPLREAARRGFTVRQRALGRLPSNGRGAEPAGHGVDDVAEVAGG
jgi:hypothetical protein